MIVSKHLTHFCFPIRLVLHQHLNSYVAYPGIPPEISHHTRGQYQHLALYPHFRLLCSKFYQTSSPERALSTSIRLELHLVQPHCTKILSMVTICDITDTICLTLPVVFFACDITDGVHA